MQRKHPQECSVEAGMQVTVEGPFQGIRWRRHLERFQVYLKGRAHRTRCLTRRADGENKMMGGGEWWRDSLRLASFGDRSGGVHRAEPRGPGSPTP